MNRSLGMWPREREYYRRFKMNGQAQQSGKAAVLPFRGVGGRMGGSDSAALTASVLKRFKGQASVQACKDESRAGALRHWTMTMEMLDGTWTFPAHRLEVGHFGLLGDHTASLHSHGTSARRVVAMAGPGIHSTRASAATRWHVRKGNCTCPVAA